MIISPPARLPRAFATKSLPTGGLAEYLTRRGGRKGLWMSSYRYVVFPAGRQPTADEVHQLQQFAGLLANHFAWGVARQDGRLALACEGVTFDHARQIDAGFDALVSRWEARGCELLDHLGFVKDATALRPTSTASPSPRATKAAKSNVAGGERAPHDRVSAREPTRKHFATARTMLTQEAIASSLLSVERTLERYDAVQRLAAAFPYVLMAVAAAATLGVGWMIRGALLESPRERRQETIERMVEGPMEGESADDEL